MNIEEMLEMVMESSFQIDENFSLDQLTDLMVDNGIDITEFSTEELDQLLSMCVDAQESAKVEVEADTEDENVSGRREVAFTGAGKCYNCHGTGVVWNFSEGMNEKCHVCGGSGIGPE